MKISFAGTSVPIKNGCNFFFIFQLARQCNTIGHSVLRSKVRNHSNDMMFVGTEMERAVPAFCITAHSSLPLRKKPVQRKVSGSKYTEVSMHGQNVFVF